MVGTKTTLQQCRNAFVHYSTYTQCIVNNNTKGDNFGTIINLWKIENDENYKQLLKISSLKASAYRPGCVCS